MTEQATLTPELAILAVASAVCQTCEGTRVLVSSISNEDYTEEETTMDCPDCLGSDGKLTGGRFPTLTMECSCFDGDDSTICTRCWDTGGEHFVDCSVCNAGRVLVTWTDERTIRLALEAAGFPVRYLDGQWNVSHPGTDRFPRDGCADLAVAADRAIKAEASDA
jgi:hypothetical protein